MFWSEYFGGAYMPAPYFPDIVGVVPPVVGGDSELFFEQRHLKVLFMGQSAHILFAGRSAHILFAPKITR